MHMLYKGAMGTAVANSAGHTSLLEKGQYEQAKLGKLRIKFAGDLWMNPDHKVEWFSARSGMYQMCIA